MAALAAGCSSRDEPDPLASLPGAVYDPPRPAARLHLSAGDRAHFDLAEARGHVALVFFGFTECPDVCPETLRRWAEVHHALGADTSAARFIFVSIDPEHDSPSDAGAYARQFHPSFIGVTGTRAEVNEAARAWGVMGPGGSDEPRTHTSQVFVVDAKGLLRWGYGRSATTEEITRGIRLFARDDRRVHS